MVRKHRNGLKPVMAEPLVVNGRHEGKGREEGPFGGLVGEVKGCVGRVLGAWEDGCVGE